MEQTAPENLSQLLHVESLVGRLSGLAPQASPAQTAEAPGKLPEAPKPNAPARVLPLERSEARGWLRDVLCAGLHEKLSARTAPAGAQPGARVALDLLGRTSPNTLETAALLGELLDVLSTDVLAARDRLLMLNPGRRKLIEHRLEFIARRVARSRGERLNRSLSLPDVLKESYRDAAQGAAQAAAGGAPKLSIAAWRGFVSEVALYNLMQLFFLKSLDVYGWRAFEESDLGRMNFAAHTFLSQRANGFAHDKHCWNFVRTNLYSWYVPSQQTVERMTRALRALSAAHFTWSDRDLEVWVAGLAVEGDASASKTSHLDFEENTRVARIAVDLLERDLAAPLTTSFQGRPVCRKLFVPALELGGVSVALLDRLLRDIRRATTADLSDESSQLHRALWSCEAESFEVFWTEVLSLLKTLRYARGGGDYSAPSGLTRLPHVTHIVNTLGLELHNFEQLPLGGPEVSRMHQGSAGQIQQLENFDAAIVTDHPDRVKSATWMKALAQQIPYWRTLIGTGTNLNWGELHLHLAMSKLREGGTCLYFSHRALPEGGDGERLRKILLNLGTFDYFVELAGAKLHAARANTAATNDASGDETSDPRSSASGEAVYRYLYIFRRTAKKLERDLNRPRFGRVADFGGALDLSRFEESSCTQTEISERGWDHLFVRGAAPLIRHLNHKFPKLFQVASVSTGPEQMGSDAGLPGGAAQGSSPVLASGLFAGKDLKALEMAPDGAGGYRFQPAAAQRQRDGLLVFPHNPIDIPWIQCLLNSAPAQFWVRQQLLAAASPSAAAPAGKGLRPLRLHDLRSCPIVDLSHVPTEFVHDALDWIGNTKPDAQALRTWACGPDQAATSTLIERGAKYVALAKHFASLERIVARYKPLFTGPAFDELSPDAVTQFYPAALLCHLSQSPDVRIQCLDRNTSSSTPENWTLDEVHSVVREAPGGGKAACYVVTQTRQGPSIQMMAPLALREYLTSQMQGLRGHTWGEALSLLRVPRDVALFTAQTHEIVRVVGETAREQAVYARTLEELALDLFEISVDVRQFLPH